MGLSGPASPRAATGETAATSLGALSARPWSAAAGPSGRASGDASAAAPPPRSVAAATAPPSSSQEASTLVSPASAAPGGAGVGGRNQGATAAGAAGDAESGDRLRASSASAGATPFADVAGESFVAAAARMGSDGGGSSGGSPVGPPAALPPSAPSARGPELDPFDIAAHSAVPPGALTLAASAATPVRPAADAEPPLAGAAQRGPAGAPAAAADGGAAALAGPSEPGSDPASRSLESTRPPALHLAPGEERGEGGEHEAVEGVVRVTAEFSPLGSGPLGQAALQEGRQLKRGPSPLPSPPPAAPRQAVH